MRYLRRLRRWIERLGPYQSLFLVAVPLAVVEPLKMATLLVVGKGHWLGGTIAMLCFYAISLLITHVVFKLVKPKLLTLPWFAAFWTWLVALRDKVWGSPRPKRALRGKA